MDIDYEQLGKMFAGLDLSKYNGEFVATKFVENEIGTVEAGGIGIQKNYYGAQAEVAAPMDSEKKSKQGAPMQYLFALNGDSKQEDTERKRTEQARLMQYLAGHELKSTLLTSKDDKLNKVVVCFCKLWQQKGWVAAPISTPALLRFLTDDCGIGTSVIAKTWEGAMRKLLRGQPDDNTYYAIKECFSK
ncbi:MAG: hypothetical protein ACI30A_06850 [Paludibacteraceae bacterium]